ncbi:MULTISPECIES: GIY-YIG nuclease family protein [unclassified Aeromicrobium]|uniref:GIY-YIG nuclease family protein n=1 Tax=unclassified Aeromicrobium TaxID=2633570 RepID=UPI00288C002E|nr:MULTISPECIES: GIY-YIG nuclease family protein [unclassified Aeromicrobium]
MRSVDRRLRRWAQWLSLSTTPTPEGPDDPVRLLDLEGGRIVHAPAWPLEERPRIYVAVDDVGPVYVGQTCDRLEVRVRRHFSAQVSLDQRMKAGTWRGVASASFPGLALGELNILERRAAEWVVPFRHRRGRRHPRST